MIFNHLLDGISNLAQFLIPAVLIAWADRRRDPVPVAVRAGKREQP